MGNTATKFDAPRDAAACATLIDTDDGPRFGPSFGEIVEFIAAMPF